MAFPVNPTPPQQIHFGRTPATGPAPVTAQPAAAEPHDQVQTSASYAAPAVPSEQRLPNQLKIQPVMTQGAVTALYATLPGGPGQLLQLPVMLSISVLPGQNTLGATFHQAKAYQMGPDGKLVRDPQNNPQELPATVMSDGRIYVQTNPENPSAPLAMLDADGSFGLATPARLNNPADPTGTQGYTRDQAEFVKAVGTHGFRVNEQVGAFGQTPQQSGVATALTAMINPLALLANQGAAGGREVTYTEVNYTPQGPESRDVLFQQAPGQNWPQFDLGAQWKSRLTFSSGGMETRARTVKDNGQQITLEGGWNMNRLKKMFTEGSGMGTNMFTYGSQQTITFTPLSRQRAGVPTPSAPASATPPTAPPPPPPPPL